LFDLLVNPVIESKGQHGIEVDALDVALAVLVAQHEQLVAAIFD